MQKKKSLLYIFVIIIIILIFGGVMLLLYLKTDMFKSKKQIFYKYLFEDNQILEVLSNDNIENNKRSYTSTGNIEYIYEYNNEIEKIEEDQIAKNLQEEIKKLEKFKGLNANIESKVDKTNNKSYYNMNLKKDNDNIMNIELIEDGNKYAIKSKQIVNGYIGIENKNLKDLANKLNIQNIENIPDELDLSKINLSLLEINSDEKEHIIQTYKDIMIQEINDQNYNKQKEQKIVINNNEYITNLYSLSLSKTESMNILIKMLTALKQDSITLNLISNKIKVIYPDSEYTSINKIKEKIDEYIESVNEIEKSDKEFIRVDLYLDKNIVRKIDFSFENQKQISFEYEEDDEKQVLTISQNRLVEESNAIVYDLAESILKTKQIKIIKEKDITTYRFIMYDVEDIYKKNLEDIKAQKEYAVEEDINAQERIEEIERICELYKTIDNETSEISFNIQINNKKTDKAQTDFYIMVYNSKIGIRITEEKNHQDDIEEIEDLNENNSIMLNNYSKEQIDKLLKSIIDRSKKILESKIEI